MCDYSLHAVKSRPARIGDTLKVAAFRGTPTRGLCDANGDPDCAVCLKPGTELRFDNPLLEKRFNLLAAWVAAMCGYGMTKKHAVGVATFLKVNTASATSHHDALDLPNGRVVLINNLLEGQLLSVLQVPAEAVTIVGIGGSGGEPGPVIAAHWPIEAAPVPETVR